MKKTMLFFCLLILSISNLFPQQKDFPKLSGPYLGQKPPGITPEIFAPEIFSTERGNHSSPVFSPSGKEVYWASMKSGILYMIYKNGSWTSPVIAPFQTGIFEFCDSPFFWINGNRLYFVVLITIGDSEKEVLYYVDRINNSWSDPKEFDSLTNNVNLHWQFSFAENGNFYFAAERKDGFGRYDIYKSVYSKGKYMKPENLGKLFNTKESDAMPFISHDESFLLFASAGRKDCYGKTDLYVSFKKKNGSWTEPVNFGPNINSANHEICPVISPDKKFLFFLSGENVYWVDAKIIDELRPKE